MNDRRQTMHCDMCGINWPWHQDFITCPACGEDTRPLNLITPSTLNDHIMDEAEAMAYLKSNDIDSPLFYKKLGPVNLQKDLAELNADCDKWATAAPFWMKR